VSDELHIVVVGSSGLPPQAKAALKKYIETYGKDALQEAGRLEAQQHSGPGAPMITDSHIADADVLLRRGLAQRKKSKKGIALTAASYLATAGAGVFGSYLSKPFGSIGFAICVTVGVVALVLGRD
jgi:hypothetical protein